jgi:hypothetical protein
MEEIVKHIRENPDLLLGQSRRSTYPRYYLFGKLRDHGLTCCEVGQLFGLNHSTVIHGTRQHDFFEQIEDQLYLEYTDQLRVLFEIRPGEICLEEDVLHCNSLRDLAKIKARVRRGLYLNSIPEQQD